MATVKEVLLPDIGDFKDVDVIEVLVAPGDRVKQEDSLITLESDKATMEVPSPYAGKVKEINVRVGDKVSEGSLVLTLTQEEAPGKQDEESEEEATPQPESAEEPQKEQAPPTAAPPSREPARAAPLPEPAAGERPPPAGTLAEVDEGAFRKAHASPSVRHFARELGVDLGRVRGTGPKDRVLKEDVQAFVKSELARPRGAGLPGGISLPEAPEIDFASFGPIEKRPLTRIQKLSGGHLHRNWLSIPHVTQFDDADITELEAFRKSLSDEAQRREVKLTLLAFLVKAAVAALKAFPDFNASLERGGESLVLKRYYHIGFAADTKAGLVVPVLRDADKRGLFEVAGELGRLSEKARAGKLTPSDMQGGCFTISSLGGIGGTAFTPIINAPEVAVLGVSRAVTKPVYREGTFVPRLLMPLSLSYDHRVIDGAAAARFITYLSGLLADIRRLLL